MVTTEPHQSQDLMVPHEIQNQEEQASPSSAVFDLEKFSQGPVNAITVLTLLDKLVNMLDAVQENQHKMEVRQSPWSHLENICFRSLLGLMCLPSCDHRSWRRSRC